MRPTIALTLALSLVARLATGASNFMAELDLLNDPDSLIRRSAYEPEPVSLGRRHNYLQCGKTSCPPVLNAITSCLTTKPNQCNYQCKYGLELNLYKRTNQYCCRCAGRLCPEPYPGNVGHVTCKPRKIKLSKITTVIGGATKTIALATPTVTTKKQCGIVCPKGYMVQHLASGPWSCVLASSLVAPTAAWTK